MGRMRNIKGRIKSILSVRPMSKRPGVGKIGHIAKIEFKKDITIVRLKGDLTVETIDAIDRERKLKFKDKKVKNILVDLKRVSKVDTIAVASLVERLKEIRLEEIGGKIGLINLTPEMRTLLEMTKTKELFVEYKSEKEAVKRIKYTKDQPPVLT